MRITVFTQRPIAVIRPQLHGHFIEHLGACVDGGIWVGEQSSIANYGGLRADVVDAMAQLDPPVLRWPGGCFADDYHWEDGIGSRKDRPRRVNIWWGGDIETNQFGTHEFIDLCRWLKAEPYLAGNVGSGAVREMRDWVEYCNFAGDSTLARRRAMNGSPQPFAVRYWGVGNEAWGCGGNFCPEDYAAEYKRYATYVREYSGAAPMLIACGPDGNNLDWTDRFFTKLGSFSRISGYAAHYYAGTAGPSATEFNADQWCELLEKAHRIEALIVDQRQHMDRFDPQRKIGLIIDEWGTWHLPTPGRNPAHLWQQNTLRDALAAAISLDAFHRQADKLVMANIAQAVNVLQAMLLTDGDRLLRTPTYHVFDLYQPHRNGQSVQTDFEAPAIPFRVGDERRELPGLSGSASIRSGVLTLTVVNPHPSLPCTAELEFDVTVALKEVSAIVLTHGELTAHNTFDEPDTVILRQTPTNLAELRRHVFPPASVTRLQARLA